MSPCSVTGCPGARRITKPCGPRGFRGRQTRGREGACAVGGAHVPCPQAAGPTGQGGASQRGHVPRHPASATSQEWPQSAHKSSAAPRHLGGRRPPTPTPATPLTLAGQKGPRWLRNRPWTLPAPFPSAHSSQPSDSSSSGPLPSPRPASPTRQGGSVPAAVLPCPPGAPGRLPPTSPATLAGASRRPDPLPAASVLSAGCPTRGPRKPGLTPTGGVRAVTRFSHRRRPLRVVQPATEVRFPRLKRV